MGLRIDRNSPIPIETIARSGGIDRGPGNRPLTWQEQRAAFWARKNSGPGTLGCLCNIRGDGDLVRRLSEQAIHLFPVLAINVHRSDSRGQH
jgi:hypothetical protein